jgi:electron transfer flavoprotein beta subunit
MKSSFSIAVLVSAGRHPASGAPRACRGDAVAMALGITLAGDALRVLHAGDSRDPALRDYLAYGAPKIEVLPSQDRQDFVPAIAASLRDCDVILTGVRAERGAGSGLLPYLLAEALGRPIIANVLDVKIESTSGKAEAYARQFLPRGQRRKIACALPLVMAVHPFATVGLKYAYARRVSGHVEIASSPLLEAGDQPSWAEEAIPRMPVRLKAQDKKTGHARLLSAIASDAKGGAVAFEGTAVDKAQVVLNYLREHRLVDF